MPKYIGDKLLKARYVGSQAITKIYRGASLVWGAIKETLAQISGKSMTLVNCTREESLNDFKIYGKSEQTKYNGYQLIDYGYYFANPRTSNGVTCTPIFDDNGTLVRFDFSGISTARVSFSSTINRVMYAGTYTLSCGGPIINSLNVNIAYRYSDETTIRYFDTHSYTSTGKQTVTLTKQWILINTVLDVRYADKDVNGLSLYPMFEMSSIAHSYEPYVGGIPSPSPSYPQSIESVVEPIVSVNTANLWDEEWVRGDLNSQGEIVSGNYICGTSYIKVTPNTAYTIFTFKDKEPSAIPYYYVEYDKDKARVKGYIKANNGTSFVTSNITEYIRFQYGSGYGTPATYTNDIMVVEGSTEPTEYQPYEVKSYTWNHTLYGIPVSSNGNYTDESGQQWIADYVDVENKKLVHNIFYYEFTGTEPFLRAADNCQYYDLPRDRIPLLANGYAETKCMSDMLTGMPLQTLRSLAQRNSNNVLLALQEPTFNRFWLSVNANVADLKGAKAIFVRNEPYSEDLTDAEIEAFKQLKTFKPTTIVSNNYDAHMSASYHTKLEELDAQLINLYNSDIKEITT